MSNSTVMTAKNSFAKGLLMDFSPENTNAESMTSALNATLLTFNGNEGSLQNDMGNGRVETAYLPEGYIPVGSCEFGDIIYIVSYNPLIDKAQIGCFPSPERNLSSDELGQESVIVKNEEFQQYVYNYYGFIRGRGWVSVNPPENEINRFVEINEAPSSGKVPANYNNSELVKVKIGLSGKLKNNNVRKILYKSNLNPGDQYTVIYDDQGDLNNITDYKTPVRKLNSLPKLLNIKVVSIEDSGKMTVLDSNVKWYDTDDVDKYFKFCKTNDVNTSVDLDSYRTIVSSAYNTYSSKISGKLALLIELEKITGFSCGWEAISLTPTYRYCLSSRNDSALDVFKENGNIVWYENIPEPTDTYKYVWYQYKINDQNWSTSYYIDNQFNFYDIYLNYSWETNNKNINPKYTILTESVLKDEKGNILSDMDIDIPSVYNELNPRPLHTFGRIYKPENADTTYLYDSYINTYLHGESGKIKASGNENNPNITSLLHLYENGSYQYDNENIGNTETVNVGKYLLNAKRGYYDSETSQYKYENKDGVVITPVSISDDVINNTFKTQVRKKLKTFVVPKNAINVNYHYTICPAMPYGMLEEYAISDVIQLNKLGTTNIQIKDWRYYVYSNLLTLTWGLDAYVEPGKHISEVTFEFYDNCGITAAYHASNYNTYNGTFTVNIPLETKNTVLNNKAWDDTEFQHIGKHVIGNIIEGERIYQVNTKQEKTYDSDPTTNIGYVYTESAQRKGNTTYHYDDSGVLLPNLLYLVKIVVNIKSKLSTGNFINENNQTKIFYRWMWTNTMFNNEYQKVTDFDHLQPSLELGIHCDYTTKQNDKDGLYEWKVVEQDDRVTNLANGNTLNASRHLQIINSENKPNIKMIPTTWIVNNYQTFRLNSDNFNDMNAIICFANEYIENSEIQPNVQFYKGVIPGANQELQNQLNENSNQFSIQADLQSSEYAKDLQLTRKGNYLKFNTYGKLV